MMISPDHNRLSNSLLENILQEGLQERLIYHSICKITAFQTTKQTMEHSGGQHYNSKKWLIETDQFPTYRNPVNKEDGAKSLATKLLF